MIIAMKTSDLEGLHEYQLWQLINGCHAGLYSQEVRVAAADILADRVFHSNVDADRTDPITDPDRLSRATQTVLRGMDNNAKP